MYSLHRHGNLKHYANGLKIEDSPGQVGSVLHEPMVQREKLRTKLLQLQLFYLLKWFNMLRNLLVSYKAANITQTLLYEKRRG